MEKEKRDKSNKSKNSGSGIDEKKKDKKKESVDKSQEKSKEKSKDKSKPEKESKQNSSQQEIKQEFQNLPQPKLCMHHGLAITHFCESCEEPICQSCSNIGPHHYEIHRINRIEATSASRSHKLNELFQHDLTLKKQFLISNCQKAEYKLQEIKQIKGQIEKDIKNEYNSMLERLYSIERQKQSFLKTEISEIQEDLNEMNKLYKTFTNFQQQDPLVFLLHSRKIYEGVELLVNKPYQDSVEVRLDDFPRELDERKAQLKKMEFSKEISMFKDCVIKKLLLKHQEDIQNEKEEMERATKDEMNEWEKLTDKFATQVQKFQMVCSYCLVALDEKNINETCPKNLNISEFRQMYTHNQPPKDYNNCNRHYFSKPIKELFEGEYKKSIVKQTVKKSPLQVYFENVSEQVRNVCLENSMDLGIIFKQHDKQKNGLLNYIQFSYIMLEFAKLTQEDIATITKFLDPQGKQQIDYVELMMILFNPDYFQENQGKLKDIHGDF